MSHRRRLPHAVYLFGWTVTGGSPVPQWSYGSDTVAARYCTPPVAILWRIPHESRKQRLVSALSERDIRDQIERIASSAAFRTSDRLKHFITFVTSQALQGKGDNLKDTAVGVQVFGRETAFDPRTDPVVRVQARRLRARLERYYHEEGQNDEIVVDLPKGGYAPVFRRAMCEAPLKPVALASPQENTVAVQPSST